LGRRQSLIVALPSRAAGRDTRSIADPLSSAGRLARLTAAALVLALPGCGESPAPRTSARILVQWRPALPVTQVVDVAGPRADGRLVLAADGRLELMQPGHSPAPFARGSNGYATPTGPEPYIAVSRGDAVARAGCRFPRDAVYALEPQAPAGVIAVDARGRARRLLDLPGAGLPGGIAFDRTGRFGHRLLVTRTLNRRTTVLAIDCRGRARTITSSAPAMEGGLAVAPRTFGRFAGHLIAPDEHSGRIVAVAPSGRMRLVARSGLAAGPDIGVESAGFVPNGFGPGWSAYLADRVSPGNPHPGDDVLLALSARSLTRAGVRPGDLLVSGEGGAQTIAIRCDARCSVRHVAGGPQVAHAEGHIAFARTR
jgi:hypothetical protein